MSDEMPQGKETVSDTEIVEWMVEDDDPFHSSAEVAQIFDHTRQWAHERLQDLHERDVIKRKKAGERSVIWWPSQSGSESANASRPLREGQ